MVALFVKLGMAKMLCQNEKDCNSFPAHEIVLPLLCVLRKIHSPAVIGSNLELRLFLDDVLWKSNQEVDSAWICASSDNLQRLTKDFVCAPMHEPLTEYYRFPLRDGEAGDYQLRGQLAV